MMIGVQEISFITYCHATEDCTRVLQALKNTIPPTIRENIEYSKQVLHGYYGNPITIYTMKISKSIDEVLRYFANQLGDTEKAILSATLDLRYDRRSNKLYIRLSKQDAYHGKLTLYDADDVIKVIISFKNVRGINRVRNYLREKGLIK